MHCFASTLTLGLGCVSIRQSLWLGGLFWVHAGRSTLLDWSGRQDIVDHDHVARPQCRRLCKCRDRRHKAPKKKRLYPSTDSGTIAEMDARSEPGLNDPFEEAIDDALSSLPADLRAAMSNVEIGRA